MPKVGEMADTLSRDQRSWTMSRVPSYDTSAEMRVRRVAHRMGLRYRVHRRDLPGNPDLVFPRFKTVLFVHGCFWHQHAGCRRAMIPKTRSDYWKAKFERNRERDTRVDKALTEAGWRVEVLWECEVRHEDRVAEHLRSIFFPRP